MTKKLTLAPIHFRQPPEFKPTFRSIAGDIRAAMKVIDTVTKRLTSLRAGLLAIETKAMSTTGDCVPLTGDLGPNWIPLREAAAIAKVCRSTVNGWVSAGIVPKEALLPIGKKRCRYSRAWFEMHRAIADDRVDKV